MPRTAYRLTTGPMHESPPLPAQSDHGASGVGSVPTNARCAAPAKGPSLIGSARVHRWRRRSRSARDARALQGACDDHFLDLVRPLADRHEGSVSEKPLDGEVRYIACATVDTHRVE